MPSFTNQIVRTIDSSHSRRTRTTTLLLLERKVHISTSEGTPDTCCAFGLTQNDWVPSEITRCKLEPMLVQVPRENRIHIFTPLCDILKQKCHEDWRLPEMASQFVQCACSVALIYSRWDKRSLSQYDKQEVDNKHVKEGLHVERILVLLLPNRSGIWALTFDV